MADYINYGGVDNTIDEYAWGDGSGRAEQIAADQLNAQLVSQYSSDEARNQKIDKILNSPATEITSESIMNSQRYKDSHAIPVDNTIVDYSDGNGGYNYKEMPWNQYGGGVTSGSYSGGWKDPVQAKARIEQMADLGLSFRADATAAVNKAKNVRTRGNIRRANNAVDTLTDWDKTASTYENLYRMDMKQIENDNLVKARLDDLQNPFSIDYAKEDVDKSLSNRKVSGEEISDAYEKGSLALPGQGTYTSTGDIAKDVKLQKMLDNVKYNKKYNKDPLTIKQQQLEILKKERPGIFKEKSKIEQIESDSIGDYVDKTLLGQIFSKTKTPQERILDAEKKKIAKSKGTKDSITSALDMDNFLTKLRTRTKVENENRKKFNKLQTAEQEKYLLANYGKFGDKKIKRNITEDEFNDRLGTEVADRLKIIEESDISKKEKNTKKRLLLSSAATEREKWNNIKSNQFKARKETQKNKNELNKILFKLNLEERNKALELIEKGKQTRLTDAKQHELDVLLEKAKNN